MTKGSKGGVLRVIGLILVAAYRQRFRQRAQRVAAAILGETRAEGGAIKAKGERDAAHEREALEREDATSLATEQRALEDYENELVAREAVATDRDEDMR